MSINGTLMKYYPFPPSSSLSPLSLLLSSPIFPSFPLFFSPPFPLSLCLSSLSPFSLPLAALQSVFPQTELGMFMALSSLNKEKQLHELSSIVTGIRLFNRDCGKGGEGIDDCKSMHGLYIYMYEMRTPL